MFLFYKIFTFCSLLYIVSLFSLISNRKDILKLILGIEMGFLSIILLLVLYGTLLDDFLGQLLSLVIIVNSGVDSAVGLALLINLYKKKGSIRFEALSLIRK